MAFRKKERRPGKVFNYRELADYYGINYRTVSHKLKDIDLRTLEGVVQAIRLLDRRYG